MRGVVSVITLVVDHQEFFMYKMAKRGRKTRR
jgi:hypothetical protein